MAMGMSVWLSAVLVAGGEGHVEGVGEAFLLVWGWVLVAVWPWAGEEADGERG